MPRKNGVYRTISMVNVECLTVDVSKEKNQIETFSIPAECKDRALKTVKKLYETDLKIIVLVKNIKECEPVKFCMPLLEYVKNSEVVANVEK